MQDLTKLKSTIEAGLTERRIQLHVTTLRCFGRRDQGSYKAGD